MNVEEHNDSAFEQWKKLFNERGLKIYFAVAMDKDGKKLFVSIDGSNQNIAKELRSIADNLELNCPKLGGKI